MGMTPGTIQQLVTALTEIARFADSEDQQDEIIAFRWQAVKLARESLTATGHDWTVRHLDTSRCPECNEPGTPQTSRNGVFFMVCEAPHGCDYEDQWEHIDPEGGE
jgi:hypothetical protein